MRKIVIVVFVALSFCISVSAFAADLAGTITYKGDSVQSVDAVSRTENRIEVYARYKGLVGVGVETIITPKTAYSLFRPYATITKGVASVVAGYSADSKKAEHAFVGIWVAPAVGNLKAVLDMRNYTALSSTAFSYQDNFGEITYSVTEKFSAGVNVIYDHYWEKNKDIVLVGPVAYYAISNQVKIFTRISREWVFSDQPTESADRFRLGVRFLF